MKVNGKLCYLWRAVDHEGEVLEAMVTARRDKAAALKPLKRIMKYGRPQKIVTDGLSSYSAAKIIGRNPQRRLTDSVSDKDRLQQSVNPPIHVGRFRHKLQGSGIRHDRPVVDAYEGDERSFVATLEGEQIDRRRFRSHNEARVPSRRWLELGWRSLRVVQPK